MLEGNGGVKRKPSSWKLMLRKVHGLPDWLTATGAKGREYVSNVCAVLGGLGDKETIAGAIEELSLYGLLRWMSARADEWIDHDPQWGPHGDRRLSLGHPCLVQFKDQRGLLAAMECYGHDSRRADAGGARTLKLEYSMVEMNLAREDRGGPDTLYRMSPDEGRGFLKQPCYYGAQGDIFGAPAESWPINVGKRPRTFAQGTYGSKSWSDANTR